jgi:hypothetical protein
MWEGNASHGVPKRLSVNARVSKRNSEGASACGRHIDFVIAAPSSVGISTGRSDQGGSILRELIEAKMRGRPIKPQAVQTPAPVVDLMAAPKRSLAQETQSRESREDSTRPAARRTASARRRRP